mmetsp:Transcript_12639/g.26796  ORF Transcript_12639/g.26796 Transcript_12639/m.26796 type:complete len:239 (+) Transcript_12639:78-794(+)
MLHPGSTCHFMTAAIVGLLASLFRSDRLGFLVPIGQNIHQTWIQKVLGCLELETGIPLAPVRNISVLDYAAQQPLIHPPRCVDSGVRVQYLRMVYDFVVHQVRTSTLAKLGNNGLCVKDQVFHPHQQERKAWWFHCCRSSIVFPELFFFSPLVFEFYVSPVPLVPQVDKRLVPNYVICVVLDADRHVLHFSIALVCLYIGWIGDYVRTLGLSEVKARRVVLSAHALHPCVGISYCYDR